MIPPGAVRSAGPQITAVARLGGIHLDEEQQYLAEATSGVGADGRWSAFEAVTMGPRQSLGKTEYLLARVLAGLYVFGEELIVFSAHRASTTTKAFRRLRRAIDRNPRLGARIARVSNRIGSERIELATGQAVEMVARSTSSGRGFTGDCLCLDLCRARDYADTRWQCPVKRLVGRASAGWRWRVCRHSHHRLSRKARTASGGR